MFKSFFTTAWRFLIKHRLNSFINILGLSVGVCVCLLILFFISYEKSWDKFHSKHERIYRLNEIQDFPGMSVQKVTYTMYPMGPGIKEEFQQVENFARIFPASPKLITYGDKKLVFKNSFWTDSTFFDIFDFADADIKNALTQPNTAVLTLKTAKQIFGDINVTGKYFLRDTTPFKVTAVIKDIPDNSHLQFDALFSMITIDEEAYSANWGENFLGTYLLLKPGADPLILEKQFTTFIRKHIHPDFAKNYSLFLQPLNQVHLGSWDLTHDDWNNKTFNGTYISLFVSLAVIVLIIAFVNFINLAVGGSASRAKEVGVKKSIGASKGNIALQFVVETIVLTFIAFTFALVLAWLATPYLNLLTDRTINFKSFLQPALLLAFYMIAVILAILASLYPSFYMASFKTIKVLKGRVFDPNQRFPVKNILVTGQFTIAIILIIGTLVVNNQLKYMRSKDPGFNKEQVIIVPVSNQASEKKQVLLDRLLSTKGVKEVSFSGQRLGNPFQQGYIKFETPKEGIKEGNMTFIRVDERYIPLYQLKLVKGRNFSKEIATEVNQSYIINERLAQDLGFEDPIGKSFALGGPNTPLGKIVGVVKDFNFNSLKNKIEPMVMVYGASFREISIRINGADVDQELANIKKSWDEVVYDRPFEYTFLDEHFTALYKTELQLTRVTSMAAGLSIFIACLGILGLISITIQQKIKEIGIRKLLGSSTRNILYIISKGTIRLVLIAFLISIPVSWWAMNNWLNDFAYRTELHWWIFLIAGGGALLIALLTVGIKSMKAAIANPVKNLRTE